MGSKYCNFQKDEEISWKKYRGKWFLIAKGEVVKLADFLGEIVEVKKIGLENQVELKK